MIVVELHEDAGGYPQWFRVMGHAGFDATGRDVVCAGVSAIAQMVLRALQEQVKAPGTFQDDAETLLVKPAWTREGSLGPYSFPEVSQTTALLRAAWLGFREIAKAYPGHVAINTVTEG